VPQSRPDGLSGDTQIAFTVVKLYRVFLPMLIVSHVPSGERKTMETHVPTLRCGLAVLVR
jgi:hypothetical protein